MVKPPGADFALHWTICISSSNVLLSAQIAPISDLQQRWKSTSS